MERTFDPWQQEALSAILDAAKKTGKITVKGLKVVSGVQAVQDRKKSITNKKETDKQFESVPPAHKGHLKMAARRL